MISVKDFYTRLYRIRRFEETVLENFPKGVFFGTTHTYLGQEANAVGVLCNLQSGDIVFSNHRCHGHFLAYGGDLRSLFAELMGKSTGVCGGHGGSQHLHWRNFYSNGVQGGIVPVATGMALAEKVKKSNAVVVAFIGDGTLGEGVIYEAFNMAALWNAPILYVLENNLIAQTTPINLAVAGEIRDRFSAFGIPVLELDTSDVREVAIQSNIVLEKSRSRIGPQALILHTWRFGPHSKGDDTRTVEELNHIRELHDPLSPLAAYLKLNELHEVRSKIDQEVQAAFEEALNDPLPTSIVPMIVAAPGDCG
jgi:TPP-dependent pyruvate/acetoin dehydrogenase alpha subunit